MRFNPATAVAWPGLIGLASGLVGAGGAFLLVPVLIAILRVPVRVSIGTKEQNERFWEELRELLGLK